MCGIWAFLGYDYDFAHNKEFLKIAGRGPDLTIIENVQPNVWLGFHRLAIVQVSSLKIFRIFINILNPIICKFILYLSREL